MSKFFKVGSKDDSLFYYVAAANRDTAIHTAEKLSGPMNPNRRVVTELPEMPKGYLLGDQLPCILEEDPEYDG